MEQKKKLLPGFLKLSEKNSDFIQARLPPPEWGVFAFLSRKAFGWDPQKKKLNDGQVTIPIDTIAEHCFLGVRTAEKHLRKLEARNLMDVIRGHRAWNTYIVRDLLFYQGVERVDWGAFTLETRIIAPRQKGKPARNKGKRKALSADPALKFQSADPALKQRLLSADPAVNLSADPAHHSRSTLGIDVLDPTNPALSLSEDLVPLTFSYLTPMRGTKRKSEEKFLLDLVGQGYQPWEIEITLRYCLEAMKEEVHSPLAFLAKAIENVLPKALKKYGDSTKGPAPSKIQILCRECGKGYSISNRCPCEENDDGAFNIEIAEARIRELEANNNPFAPILRDVIERQKSKQGLIERF